MREDFIEFLITEASGNGFEAWLWVFFFFFFFTYEYLYVHDWVSCCLVLGEAGVLCPLIVFLLSSFLVMI